MKGMRKIVRGGGFRGVLDYAFDRDAEDKAADLPGGRLVGGNMASTDPRELAAEFGVVRAMRPDVEKPVWHNSLRLPAGEYIDPETWDAIARDYMSMMGMHPDRHQYVVVLHDDPEGQHVHIIASRIAIDGKLYHGKNENLISTRHIAALERQYGLTITKGPEYQDGKVVMPAEQQMKKGEIEMAMRTGEQPPRLQLQEAIKAALVDKPTPQQFIERLELAGITTIPNIASTGRMNGFSFSLGGVAFKASQLGDTYTWKNLEREMDYEQDRDRAYLTEHKQGVAGKDREPEPTTGEPGLTKPGPASSRPAGEPVATTGQRDVGRDGGEQGHHEAPGGNDGEGARPDLGRDRDADQRATRLQQADQRLLVTDRAPGSDLEGTIEPELVADDRNRDVSGSVHPDPGLISVSPNRADDRAGQRQRGAADRPANAAAAAPVTLRAGITAGKDGVYSFPSGRQAFRVEAPPTERIRFNTAGLVSIEAGMDVAQAKGWSSVTLTGGEEFRRKAWMVAAARGLAVKGYSPGEKDLADLEQYKAQQAAHGKAVAKDPGAAEKVQAITMPDVITPARQAKIDAWNKQHGALQAEAYRITLKDRTGEGSTWVLGKGQGPQGKDGQPTERFYNADEVRKMLGRLSAENAKGKDIYITPLSARAHYVLIDDIKPGVVDQLKKDGYVPRLVQSSSRDNQQAIITIPRLGLKDRAEEQTLANKVVGELNQAYGDPKLSGVVRPFRMAGFANKKPGKGDPFTVVQEAAAADCTKATEQLGEHNIKRLDAIAEKEATRRLGVLNKELPELANPDRTLGTYDKVYRRTAQTMQQVFKADTNWSAIDFRAGVAIVKAGGDAHDVQLAIQRNSPALAARHRNELAYLEKTMHAVGADPGVKEIMRDRREAQARKEMEKEKGWAR